MLTVKEAQRIGMKACIDKIGYDFVNMHKDSAVYAYGDGENEDSIFCYIGINDKEIEYKEQDKLILDNTSKFKYNVSCLVGLKDGNITFIECKTPE